MFGLSVCGECDLAPSSVCLVALEFNGLLQVARHAQRTLLSDLVALADILQKNGLAMSCGYIPSLGLARLPRGARLRWDSSLALSCAREKALRCWGQAQFGRLQEQSCHKAWVQG